MSKFFASVEDVLLDEDFSAWQANAGSAGGLAWKQWLAENPAQQPLVDEALCHLARLCVTEKEMSSAQMESAHKRLMQALAGEATPVLTMRPKKSLWWIPAAAAAIIIVIAVSFFFQNGTTKAVRLNTAYGQVQQYCLPDGSEVMLNANSKLSMEKWSEDNDREVWIEGEAFFHVKKTTRKNRFIVHARQMDIIVTGTQFNIIDRDDESSVLLKEGSVTLKTANGDLVKMLPGDFITVQNQQPQKESGASPEKVLAWTQSKLVFENTPLREAQKLISRHYGVTVKLDKAVEEKTISGILPNNNLDVLVKALEATTNFKIVRTNGELSISGNNN